MTMETTMNSFRNDQREADLEAKLSGVGKRIFLVGALLQSSVAYLIWITVYTYDLFGPSTNIAGGWSLRGWGVMLYRQNPYLLGIGVGGLALIVVSIPFGGWVGKMIGIRKKNFVWVGPMGAMLPALVAGCVDVATVLFLRPNWFNGQDGPMLAQFVAASMVFSLQYFIPGIVTSMVGGLWIRQKGMALVEKHRLELRQDLELDIHQRT
jgi:hypothetical protein